MDSSTTLELLTPEEIANMLKIAPRQFTERVSKHKDFPAPLNKKILGTKSRRWKKTDIINWIENGGQQA